MIALLFGEEQAYRVIKQFRNYRAIDIYRSALALAQQVSFGKHAMHALLFPLPLIQIYIVHIILYDNLYVDSVVIHYHFSSWRLFQCPKQVHQERM